MCYLKTCRKYIFFGACCCVNHGIIFPYQCFLLRVMPGLHKIMVPQYLQHFYSPGTLCTKGTLIFFSEWLWCNPWSWALTSTGTKKSLSKLYQAFSCFFWNISKSTMFISLSSCPSTWCLPTVFPSFWSSSIKTSWLIFPAKTSKFPLSTLREKKFLIGLLLGNFLLLILWIYFWPSALHYWISLPVSSENSQNWRQKHWKSEIHLLSAGEISSPVSIYWEFLTSWQNGNSQELWWVHK